VFSWLLIASPFEGLAVEGQRTVAVFALCTICWATQAIPLSITGLLALVLLPLCTELRPDEAFALFGNKAVFFILGAFIISAAVVHSGLSTRVAMIVLDRIGTTPRRLMIGLLLLSAALAHVMPEHAVAAMLLPIAIEIARALRLVRGRSRMGAGLFLALAWGSIIGGIATFLGGARAPLALELLHRSTGQTIGFMEWWLASLPLVALSLVGCAGVLLVFFRPEIESTEAARLHLRERLKGMGRASLEERLVVLVLSGTVIGWVFSGPLGLDVALVALVGAVALFVLRVISWKIVEDHVNWGVILMFGGAIALAEAMDRTGAAGHLATAALSEPLLASVTLTLLVLAVVALVLTEGISNAAVVAVFLPVGLDLAPHIGAVGIDPRLVVYAITLPAGLAFTLPISSPPNALAHSTGFIRLSHVGWRGPLLSLICLAAFLVVATLWWPLVVK
jgi:sodium-dependent dicarboxylate transporter 2/3/5